MKKWLSGIAATVISGLIIWWVTEALRTRTPESSSDIVSIEPTTVKDVTGTQWKGVSKTAEGGPETEMILRFRSNSECNISFPVGTLYIPCKWTQDRDLVEIEQAGQLIEATIRDDRIEAIARPHPSRAYQTQTNYAVYWDLRLDK